MRTHSIFSPSRLAMLSKCPSWIGMPSIEGKQSPDAERGTALHETITSCFIQDILEHDDPVVNYALSRLADIRRTYPYAQWQREIALDTGIPHVIGYCDIMGIDSFDDTGILVEVKTGYGERPKATDNIQLKAYALALLKQFETVYAYLIEADHRNVSKAKWTRQDIETIQNEILTVIELSLKGEKVTPGSHCDYCKKNLICPAIEKAVISIQDVGQSIEEIKTLTPLQVSQKLSTYWEKMELVERYWANLKARAMAIIEAGGEIEGFTVKVTSGPRRWTDEQVVKERFLNAGVSLSSVMTLQSPAQVEKTLKALGIKQGEIKSMLSGLTVSSERRQLVKA